jgi:hypothetical protein
MAVVSVPRLQQPQSLAILRKITTCQVRSRQCLRLPTKLAVPLFIQLY